MKTEDDTFRILSRCTYEELQLKMDGARESKAPQYLNEEARDKILIDNRWTMKEWGIELNLRYGRISK